MAWSLLLEQSCSLKELLSCSIALDITVLFHIEDSLKLKYCFPFSIMVSKDGTSANLNYTKHPFRLSVGQVKNHIQTDLDTGLSSAKVKDIQSKCGENKLAGLGDFQWYTVLLKQVSNAMILVCIHPGSIWAYAEH